LSALLENPQRLRLANGRILNGGSRECNKVPTVTARTCCIEHTINAHSDIAALQKSCGVAG
jgi:hypothetical protein